MLTALALVPVASLLAVELAPAGATLAQLSLVLGVVAGLVQALGLALWPFLVPMLARRHAEATTDPERTAVTVVFETTHRYLGVAVGEHLGYLLTGARTTVVGLALVASPDASDLLGWLGAGLGVTLGVGSLEFVGRPGPAAGPSPSALCQSPTSAGPCGCSHWGSRWPWAWVS